MEDFAPSPTHAGYLEKTITSETCTVTILRPILSEEERKKRLAAIKTAAEKFVRASAIIKKGRQATP